MAPGTHFLLSWALSATVLQNRRNRVLASLSGVAPDLDGIGVVVDLIFAKTNLYGKYHHVLGHNLLAALLIASICAFLAKSHKVSMWCLSFICFHLHIICDVLGSKGPDGFQWPIQYLYPFSTDFTLTWPGQWELNAWQNQLITVLLMLVCVYISATKKISFFEIFGRRINAEVFNMYEKYIKR
ncbi:metal-dependent hydrolase [Pseudoalteromonas luteoviolacea]|uniref:metal-dependent hydrolase n=1 Tax=Pseudoalteromonas luteoviolacea TaxID=43657 RepID=UPI001B3A3B43|nr:metal-dependent hydrolase [Pseudoalteromonas luteoviolacea]MBQ4877916.1 metal-dependent hydrolase [Pseudoalteromonas luteoviolacea]MBQ4906951.1 metal-dependent hydrolase [Pseudoalteromonas luteoviolacea]